MENFESFALQAEALYRQNPRKARFVTKYRHRDGKLVLKVTDDATVGAVGGMGAGAACWGRGARERRRAARPPACPHPPAHARSACNTRPTSRQT